MVTVGTGQVQVSWQASSAPLTTFNVYRGDSSGLNMRRLAAGLLSGTSTFVDPAAPVGQVVTYSVAEQNAAGEGAHSAPVRSNSTVR